METEIQNKMLFSASYSTRDVSDILGNNIWDLYNKNKAFKTDQYQNSFLKRQVIGGYSGYEKEQLRQTILKHELIFKNQLEELHRLYKRQRDLMNEIKRRELYPPPESPFADLSFIRRPISTTYTYNTQSPLIFMKREIVSSPLISHERVTSRKCENLDPKRYMFQQSLVNKRKEMRDVNMSVGSYNDLNPNLCSKRVNVVIDLNDPVETEENHSSRLTNENETGESIFGVTIGRAREPSCVSPSNKSDIITKEKRTIFGMDISEEIDDNKETPFKSKKIFGFCFVPQSSPLNPNCVPNSDHIPTSQSSDLVTEKGLNSYISGLKLQIDLNLSINEEEGTLIPPLPEAIVKIATTEIDLEAPAVLESDTDAPPELKFSENVFINTNNEQNEVLDKAAADAIVALSSSYVPINDTTNFDPISDFCDESLHWFANLVSSYNNDEDCDECCDGMDYFEFMTLNLKETNIEEYIDKSPMSLDYQKTEEIIPPNLSKRPRRGQGKRGKQRKDFQKDVLPGIVSLSRHEVADDLHSFEELFKACGFAWQSNVSKRSNAKSMRGRRRSGDCHTKEIHNCQQIGSSGDTAVEEAAVAGWGKRMRRLPRRRCRVGGSGHT